MSAETRIDDGGPAFPLCIPDFHGEKPHLQEGMSLRDWFAGQASEEDIRAHLGTQTHPYTGHTINLRSREKAKYDYADEMIAARKGGQP